MSSTDDRERRNSRSYALDLPSGLKDLSTVDLFSVYLLSLVNRAAKGGRGSRTAFGFYRAAVGVRGHGLP